MRLTKYILLLTVLILTTLNVSKAETATSGNLLPNADDGKGALQSSSSTLDNTNQNSGFTLNGIGSWNNELEASGTGTVSATGSLENITTTTQSGNSHTTTTTSLDGGVTLNATTEVQNCEWSGSSYQCGNAQSGTDSYSTTIKILDENENVLASTSIIRNNDAGYYSNTYTYTDTVTHNDTGARKWDWEWQGVDGNNPNTTSFDGPNLLGASLTATLLDITYQPAPLLSISQQTEITNATGEVEEAIEEIKFEEFEEIKFEEIKFEEIKLEEPKIEEIKIEKFEELFEENFKEILIKENLMEEFETALIEESITEEKFFEEATNIVMEELKEEFGEETFSKEEMNEETVTEIKEETVETETDTTDLKESNDTTTETKVEEESNETISESKDSENVSNESDMDKNTETEGTETEKNNEETVETTANTDVKTDSGKSIDTRSIEKKVERVIAKVLAKLKKVDQKLQAVQFITTQGMKSGEADISGYINKRIYGNNKKLNDPLADDFLQKINILEQQQIYKDASLVAYESNDPIAVKQRLTVEVEQEINRIQAELYALKQKKEQL